MFEVQWRGGMRTPKKKTRLDEKYEGICILIVCPNCGKIRKHTRWCNLTEAHWEKLKERDIRIIYESCGCLFKED